jgi:hypothetical protein
MMKGRACDRCHPANPRRSPPSQGVGGPPLSNHSSFDKYFLETTHASTLCFIVIPAPYQVRGRLQRESRRGPIRLPQHEDEIKGIGLPPGSAGILPA